MLERGPYIIFIICQVKISKSMASLLAQSYTFCTEARVGEKRAERARAPTIRLGVARGVEVRVAFGSASSICDVNNHGYLLRKRENPSYFSRISRWCSVAWRKERERDAASFCDREREKASSRCRPVANGACRYSVFAFECRCFRPCRSRMRQDV